MRRPVSSLLGWLFLLLLAGTTTSVAWADSPAALEGANSSPSAGVETAR